MRILVLAPQPFYVERGTPIAVDLLIRTLAAAGHRVEVLAFHLGDTPTYGDVTVHRIPPVPFVRAVGPGLSLRKLVCDAVFGASLVRLLARRRFDAIHAVEESVFLAMALAPRLGVPYVYDMDSSLPDQVLARAPWLRPVAPLLRAAERAAVRRSAAVAAVCDDLARRAAAGGARRVVLLRDVSLLPDAPPPPPEARAALRADLGAGAGETLVLYVGNLEPYQGIDLLVDGFAAAAARDRSLRLAVVGGEAADVARYRRRVEAAGLAARARVVGPRPVARLREHLDAADVLVSPRVGGTNTPMKLYSYLHAGRPVVATDLPTHTQVLTREAARLVRPEPAALAAALLELAADPALRARLGAAGRALVERRHGRPVFVQQVTALYDGLAGGPAREAAA
ncbi:MAG TPA: glycosyltransferase family 4 protein [Thermodesulfobacteriota bacterium]